MSFDDAMEQEYGEKSRVHLSAAPEVERRVAEVERQAAAVDLDRTLRHRVIWSGEQEVFDDDREIRKIRKNERPAPGKPVAYVYYYDGGHVSLIRVLWNAAAQPGEDEERFYFDRNALPPLIRWVGRGGRAAESWDPYREDGHGRAIHDQPRELMRNAIESRVCDHAPSSIPCKRLGFRPP
ncbi:MAG TPA: hypothetical protein VLK84_22850 [Longimicrobium sp.]|nr:hypothetical protein [Longimicrobium sp.]